MTSPAYRMYPRSAHELVFVLRFAEGRGSVVVSAGHRTVRFVVSRMRVWDTTTDDYTTEGYL